VTHLGLEVHAGHGLDYDNVPPVAALPFVEELNIGFAIIARSVFTGVDEAVRTMARLVASAETIAPRTRARRALTSVEKSARLRKSRLGSKTRLGRKAP
jgi:hypothetical protein